jgi:hypothetical protein
MQNNLFNVNHLIISNKQIPRSLSSALHDGVNANFMQSDSEAAVGAG